MSLVDLNRQNVKYACVKCDFPRTCLENGRQLTVDPSIGLEDTDMEKRMSE